MHKKIVLLLCLGFFTIGSFSCHDNAPWFSLTSQNELSYKSHWAHELALQHMDDVRRSHRSTEILCNAPCTQSNTSSPRNSQLLQHKGPTEQQMLQALRDDLLSLIKNFVKGE